MDLRIVFGQFRIAGKMLLISTTFFLNEGSLFNLIYEFPSFIPIQIEGLNKTNSIVLSYWKIKNSGNASIRPDDIYEQITVKFKNPFTGSQFLSYENRNNIKAKNANITEDGHQIKFDRFLLNASDELCFWLVYTYDSLNPSTIELEWDCKIAEIPKINVSSNPLKNGRYRNLYNLPYIAFYNFYEIIMLCWMAICLFSLMLLIRIKYIPQSPINLRFIIEIAFLQLICWGTSEVIVSFFSSNISFDPAYMIFVNAMPLIFLIFYLSHIFYRRHVNKNKPNLPSMVEPAPLSSEPCPKNPPP